MRSLTVSFRPRVLVRMAAIPLLLLVVGIAAWSRHTDTAPTSQSQSAALPPTGHWLQTALRTNTTAMQLLATQPPLLIATTTNGVWRSADSGVTWQPDGMGLQGNALFVLAGSTVNAPQWAGSFDGSVYAREVTGKSVAWRRISPVLRTDPSMGAVPIYSLAASSVSPGKTAVLTGSLGAIFRGEPNADGRTWQWTQTWRAPQPASVASGGAGAITSLLVAPWDPNLIFASVFEATPAILVSHDAGRTWTSGAAGLPGNLPVQSLAAASLPTQGAYLTTMGGGVWLRGADGHWTDVSAGLPGHHAMAMLAAGPGTLYAGTMSLGVYEKRGDQAWQPLGHGLNGSAATVMGLVETSGTHPALLAATTQGVYRYAPGG